MEKFILLFRGGLAAESPGQIQSHTQKWFEWVTKLKNEGKYVSGEPLNKGGKFIAGEKKVVTDGPFTEAKDIIGGFFIVSASSYDEAVEMAKESPDFEFRGSVEVRQIMKM